MKKTVSIMGIVLLFVQFGLGSCVPLRTNPENEMNKNNDRLVQAILELGYLELFQRSGNQAIDSLWQTYGGEDAFSYIVNDTDADMRARFLAAEIIFHNSKEAWNRLIPKILAPIYAAALAGSGGSPCQFGTYGNPWGYMSYLEAREIEGAGPLGKRLIEIGSPAVPELRKLLENPTPIQYQGSREATTGNNANYRVMDAAAYYIRKIKELPISFFPEHGERDREIAELISLLDD